MEINFNVKKYQKIPKITMSELQFKRKVLLSYQTQKGIQLTKMNKTDFQNWIGSENVKNGKIKIYRGVQHSVIDLENGDFCTTNSIYALKYGSKVISKELPLSQLRYVMGHKNGNPDSVGIIDKGVQPVELIYVSKTDIFSKVFKTFEYEKYCQYVNS